MRAFITKPIPIEKQKRFEHYARTNAYRFVFFCYGTVSHEAPYYALYTWDDVDPLALLYVSEYIVEEIVDYGSAIRLSSMDEWPVNMNETESWEKYLNYASLSLIQRFKIC